VFEIVEKSQKPFPLERAILVSIIAHAGLLLLFLSAPDGTGHADPKKGLLAAFLPAERDEPPIPVEFHEVPGPERQGPERSPLSDKDRRAGGGDPSRPRAGTPFIAPRDGIEGLDPGTWGALAFPAPGRSLPGAEGESRRQSEVLGPDADGAFESPLAAESARKGSEGRLSRLDQAIRDAARGTIAGEGNEGAGTPNPDGGFVDSGPISFDSSWYDWGPYGAEMVRRIKLHWEIPELARLGWKGKLTIRFFILADGRVADATIIRRSGVPPFDFAALQAILKSSPFRPLPADLGSSREGVTVTFFYNLRPERGREAEGTQ
jgi:TonB family protein